MKENIFFEIKKLDHLIMQNLIKGKNMENRPSPTQMRIMKYMMENKDTDIYQKDLEKHLNISRATISNVLDTMEKNGIIKRFSGEIDSRTKKVELTKKAIALNEEAKNDSYKVTQKMVKDISSKDLETFMRILKQMEENLK